MSSLRLDWADHKAAKFACEHWHYSGCMPAGKTVKVGVWEDGRYIGVVIFSRGANPSIGKPFDLLQIECVELTRIALTKHEAPVSRIVAFALKLLKKQSPGLRLVVSYADPAHGHHGGVYQAGGWIYAGQGGDTTIYHFNGKWTHARTVVAVRGTTKGLPKRTDRGKLCYLMPLDKETKQRLAPLSKPYPKRPKGHETGTPG